MLQHRVAAALLAIVLGVMLGCASSETPAAPVTAAPTASSAAPTPLAQVQPTATASVQIQPAATPDESLQMEQPQDRVESLTIAIPTDPGSPLNIYLTTNSSHDFLVGMVLEKLFGPSPYVDEPEPWLAEGITQIDPLTWEVSLRSGIRWHDGEPFTAEDVKFTFEFYQSGPPTRHTHHTNNVPDIERITVVDPRTVRFECAYPCPFLGKITLADLPILPMHIWSRVADPKEYDELPVGTGPYKLVEYRSGQYLRFEANEDYFKGRPIVDELIMPIIRDPSATFTALRTGEIDAAARSILPELLAEFEQQSDIKVVSTAPLSMVELRLNYDRAPFDQPSFRRAISLAVDRDDLVATVLLGQGRPGFKGYPHPDSPWTNPELSTPYDPAEAEAVLDEMQFTDRDGDGTRENADGEPLEFSLHVSSSEPTWVRAADLIAEDIADIGIKVNVEAVDAGTLSSLSGSREFDLYISSITPHGVADPDQFIMSNRSGYLWREGVPYPEWDSLFEEYKQTETIEERTEVTARMQTLFNNQPTSIALWYPQENWAFRPEAFDGWAESRGYGIIHKWSLLPRESQGATITRRFE